MISPNLFEQLAFLTFEEPSEKRDSMDPATLQQKVLITNPQGLHMRPAAAFASRARQFRSDVRVIKDDQRVDGKSPLELLLLVALPGSELTIEVSGEDAPDALSALVEVFNVTADE